MSKAFAVISLVLTMLLGFYVLAYTYSPMEDAGLALQRSLGSPISGENLGVCSASGNCQFYTDYSPIKTGYTVYANGIAHTSWTNATVSVNTQTGLVDITATGTNPSTAGASITIDYIRDVEISGISSLSNLPGVAILLFVLITVLSFILAATRGV